MIYKTQLCETHVRVRDPYLYCFGVCCISCIHTYINISWLVFLLRCGLSACLPARPARARACARGLVEHHREALPVMVLLLRPLRHPLVDGHVHGGARGGLLVRTAARHQLGARDNRHRARQPPARQTTINDGDGDGTNAIPPEIMSCTVLNCTLCETTPLL